MQGNGSIDAYVYRIKQPPSLKQALGIAAHNAAELDLRQKIESRIDLPLDMVLDAFSDSFKDEAADAEEKPEKKETRATMLDSGVAAVSKWHEVVAPDLHPKMVEQHVQFTLNIRDRETEEILSVPIDGTIDEVDEDGSIRDHKFVGKRPNSGEQYVLNMVGYAIGYRRMTGDIESRIVLDHIVRLKTPVHVPIVSEGPITDKAIIAYAGIVTDVTRSINAGIFPPTGLKSNACSWCGFRSICTAYQERS